MERWGSLNQFHHRVFRNSVEIEIGLPTSIRLLYFASCFLLGARGSMFTLHIKCWINNCDRFMENPLLLNSSNTHSMFPVKSKKLVAQSRLYPWIRDYKHTGRETEKEVTNPSMTLQNNICTCGILINLWQIFSGAHPFDLCATLQ